MKLRAKRTAAKLGPIATPADIADAIMADVMITPAMAATNPAIIRINACRDMGSLIL